MKTIRIRSIRMLGAFAVGCVCLIFILKSTVDTVSLSDLTTKKAFIADKQSVQDTAQDVWDSKDDFHLKQIQNAQPPGHAAHLENSETGPDLSVKKNPSPLEFDFHRKTRPPAMDESQFGDLGPQKAFPQKAKALEPKAYPKSEGYPILKRGKLIPHHRIVHFDLKGAPPKPPYFREYFRIIKELGGTGLLMEWEDMFPFTGDVSVTNNAHAYSPEEIKTILGYAKDQNLEVIPLTQTFGHLEWILQFQEFRKYREVDRFMQTICPSNKEAVDMVKDLVDQVIAAHPGIKYFHMGADEAFQVGMCDKCQRAMQNNGGSREQIMASHIANIASHIKEKHGLKVLVWHDMLNNIDNSLMEEYKLGELIEPVVWAYAENLDDYLMPEMWSRFGQVFPYIWGASSYKGADGPTRWWSNVPHYLQNHISWVSQMSRNYKEFKGEFRGLILTGWQRFDHFAVLCEILPVGFPSLAVNLLTIQSGQYDRNVLKRASTALQCSSTLDIDSTMSATFCNFPGSKIYQLTQQLRIMLQNIDEQVWGDYQIQGWLSNYALKQNFSSSWYLDQILDKLQMYHEDLKSLQMQMYTLLKEMFYPDMADEWIFVYLEPHLSKLETAMNAAQRITRIETFPKRPLKLDLPHPIPQMSRSRQVQDAPPGAPKEVMQGDRENAGF